MSHITKNIRLLIEYNGNNYYGWQRQQSLPTIQGELGTALEKLTGHTPKLIIAGRTDAGVHAIGQVANFNITTAIEPWKFAPGLNRFLPWDISIHESLRVCATFNARNDSLSKRYRYRIYQGPNRSALNHLTSWHFRAPLNINAMKQAASLLLGEHDFESFRNSECDAEHAIRHMYDILIEQSKRPPRGHFIDITFHANAFCRHMCRILAGTLIEIGLGKRNTTSISDIIIKRHRRFAGQTAPSCGLTLLEVNYPLP